MNVGVVGCGRIATLVHLPCLQKIKGCEIVAVADIHRHNLEEAMEKFGAKEAYTSHKDMLEKAAIDAVVICTPPEHHFQIALDSIQREKHVLCEKPIATTVEEALAIKKKLQKKQKETKHGLVFMPAHNFIFTPCFTEAQKRVCNNEIGKIRKIRGRAFSNLRFYKPKTDFRVQARGGVIEDELPHLLYLYNEIGGSLEKFSRVEPRSKDGVINNVYIEAKLALGAEADMSAGWAGFVPTLELDVIGEHGEITMNLLRTPYNLTVIKNGDTQTFNMGRRVRQYLDVLRYKHPSYQLEHLHFLECVEKEKEPQVSVDDGIKLVRGMNDVLAHFGSGKPTSEAEKTVVVLRAGGNVEETVQRSIDMLGGLNVEKDDLVVVKPNVCYPKNIENMIITDARVLEAVLNLVKRKTKNVLVVESDSISGTAEKRMTGTSMMDVVKECDVDFLNLSKDDVEEHEVAGCVLEIPKTVLKADFLVNLPKLKTNDMVYLSIAMKNMLGILANEKKKLHKNLPEVLAYLSKILRQDLIVVDGIIGMEGMGPIRGSPVQLGLIISGSNPVTVDAACCYIMEINPYAVESLWKAYKAGVGEIDIKRVQVLGETIDNVKRKFRLPSRSPRNIFTALKTSLKVYLKSE